MNNSIARQIQIDMITDTPNPISEWFSNIWNHLSIIETNVYHENGKELIYYIEDDLTKQWIFFQDDKNNRFLCNYSHYWRVIELEFKLTYSDMQCITKFMVENAINNEVVTPSPSYNIEDSTVNAALYKNITTPCHND